jgi:prolyl-tRNA synthetase
MEAGHAALNKEVWSDKNLNTVPNINPDLSGMKDDFVEHKAVEVGNIFTLGTKFSEAFDLKYLDENGKAHPVFMGSYGIGPGRLMGAIVELFADDKGIVWPASVAPFQAHLLSVSSDSGKAKEEADKLYQTLLNAGVEVLYDDRDLRAGEKFADADLVGIPKRVVVSDKSIASGGAEVKDRRTGKVEIIPPDALKRAVEQ